MLNGLYGNCSIHTDLNWEGAVKEEISISMFVHCLCILLRHPNSQVQPLT